MDSLNIRGQQIHLEAELADHYRKVLKALGSLQKHAPAHAPILELLLSERSDN